MLSQIVTAAKGLFSREESHAITSLGPTDNASELSTMVTATRRGKIMADRSPSETAAADSSPATGKRKTRTQDDQSSKRRKRSSLEQVKKTQDGAELPTKAPSSKTKHMRFDSEEPELPVDLDVEEEEALEPAQDDQANEDDSSDDEAPEAITNSAQLSKIKEASKKQEKMRQAQEQEKREKRRQLDELRKSQAKSLNHSKQGVSLVKKAASDDMLSESTATLQGSTTQDARTTALPAFLPDEILNAEPVTQPVVPEFNFGTKKPNKLRFLDTVERGPKDVRMGDVTIRVLDGNSTSKKTNPSLAPKASKSGRNVKKNWLERERSTAGLNGMRRTTGSSGFVRKNSEAAPLLPQYQVPGSPSNTSPRSSRPPRTVTFNPLTTISTYGGPTATDPTFRPLQTGSPPVSVNAQSLSRPSGQPMLSALNSKLRRRNSHGAPFNPPITSLPVAPKIGPQRTTKNAQKLKLLPDPVTAAEGEEGFDEDIPRDVYSQITRIKEPTARSHAARLGKADRENMPRVTAYCTANSYRLEGVLRFLKSRSKTRGANPKLFDECVYSPFDYQFEEKQARAEPLLNPEPESNDRQSLQQRRPRERRFSDSAVEVEDNTKHRREDLIDLHETNTSHAAGNSAGDAISEAPLHTTTPEFDTTIHIPEVFLFDYGTVVIWGMTPAQELRFLSDVSKFATSILSPDDTQVENFNFYYAREYQARIYNDFISLRDPRNHMTKLAISHALAQSVKTSLFEDLVSETISKTAPLPAQIAQTGSVNLTRREINMQVGELFILRINIHLQGSVLDSPELMWAEPQLEPVYQAVRSYLEMDQRVSLLTERLDVIADLLAVLKDQLTHRHGEYLEWIVIVLIAAEILVAAINIVVDLYAGVE
ncbi:hypothetical protein ASPZODRAFT_151666 [Penicilliopsis zonata CBS 506.65]|uniref:DUF155 domain-containing protein n=1 Tax=Penicilliopsis zonata CBS 506.65 TaxID=1073090 RepID=A0A1L9SIQ9_9EURO|nr:hypothetical protein ASPZODRAFT_151666 [Penicilliopsis zonata CBS 506.65]OJJ47110.1 hypothetical protein ASPZODRAFT_151666 [Penicilliopsis zonata CBS 506.65]